MISYIPNLVFSHKNQNQNNWDNTSINGNNQNLPSKKQYFSSPFTGQSSLIIKKYLKKFCFAFNNYSTIGDILFFKIEDPFPFFDLLDLIYSIPCGNCPKSYNGKTLKHLHKRINRHKYDENKLNDYKLLPSTPKSKVLNSTLIKLIQF